MHPNAPLRWLAACLLLLFIADARAETRIAGIFGDRMVLQRDRPIPLWGRAAPGASIDLALADRSARAVADPEGRWRATLDPLPAGGPHTLAVRGPDREIVMRDVLVGDVWLASGQSNMAWPLAKTKDGDAFAARAQDPQLRMLVVPESFSDAPKENLEAEWLPCEPQTAANFSATAYHFGAALRRELDVPIGLIQSARNGVRAELWMSPDALRAAGAHRREWRNKKRSPSDLYNGMIHPLIPYALRGAIWYQGESNTHGAEFYRGLLAALIRDWREKWGQGDFPFGIVQLANHRAPQSDPNETSDWAVVREAQRRVAAELPAVGLAVAIDIGEAEDIHPRDKQSVGDRLARWALARVHGKPVPHAGPVLSDIRAAGEQVRLLFKDDGGGLVLRGDPPHGFALAAADGAFQWADAHVEGDEVVVQAPAVPNPARVRYAWADNPRANLYSRSGLPASPFEAEWSQ